MADSTRTRLTAAERSEQVLTAAVTAFAETGYAATRTDEIARLAGVSQPYVIRLFGTKQRLFVAATNRACDRIEEVFRAARAAAPAQISPQDALRALGGGYESFLSERELPLILLHGFSASADPAIGDDVRERFGRIYGLIRELTGATADDARQFIATGMLITVMTAMQVIGPDAVSTPWAAEIKDCLLRD
ncbi:transcriptional regulator, TetR family [Nocardia nova SH22a]|uniref:Transcriptional regulator, TetR family n=1 Tax=Nocardia nova SH22a TaxID=1415166 RepID=W5TJ69_9NOCA|nr:TetR/AcrR family transcriptional regulator [Nocardia nova]AHH17311.1 transcriptional regulator, TetR family [Nocardia nova SH22a]